MTIKKITLLATLVAPAFSVWAEAKDRSDSMVITANRFLQPVASVLAPIDIVTREDIDRWQLKSLGEVFKRLPGVDIMQYGGRGQSASMFVRGTNNGQTLVLIDGIHLASSGVTGSIDFNQIPISLIQRVEFIRGARSSVYGSEAIGGVINIITRSNQQDAKLEAGIGSDNYQLYDGHIRQKIGQSTQLTLAGAYEDMRGFNVYPDSPMAVDADQDGFRSKSLLAEIEQQFSAEFSGFIRGYGYGNNAEYDQASVWGGSDERQLYSRNYAGGLRFQSGNYGSQLILSYQKYTDRNYEASLGKYSSSSMLDVISQRNLQWGNSYRLENGMLSAGFDWREEQTKPGTAYVTDGHTRDNNGFYLTGQQLWGQVTIEGAIRTDDNQQFGRHNTWQTAVGWQFTPDYRLTLSYGTAFRAPTFGQLYGFYGYAALQPEESNQWEAGIEGFGLLNWRLSAYRNRIKELIEYDIAAKKYYNNAKVTIKGVEWTGSIATGPLEHLIILEYIDPRTDSSGKTLARRAKHKAKYQLDWTMFNVDMDISYQYYGQRYDDKNNSVRLGSYSTLDLAGSYPVADHLIIRGRIANLFNKDYETAKGYATAKREYYLSASYSF